MPGIRSRELPRLILFHVLMGTLILGVWARGPVEAASFSVTDDTGRDIVLERPALRIIALYGAYNEILAAMGLGDRLVARTKTDNLPPSILSKPSIGTHMRPNVELVLALKPDLIIQGGGRRQAMMPVDQLSREGLSVAVFNPTNFSELFGTIARLGVLTGEPTRAQDLIDKMKTRLDEAESRLAGVSHRPRVFFEVRYPNLLAAGKHSMVDDVITRAGGSNCVRADKMFVRLNMEALIAARPEVYVVQKGAMNPDPGMPGERSNFRILDAVRKNRVLIVDEQVFSRPGPRSVEAVETLARFLYPGLWNEDRSEATGRDPDRP
ncbi:MAG: ABC transporter substrate-binding protein [Desulfomonilaceae bacterium]|nr:ABC transporter substrate-binding protein [Desulfomonilaceae bacterium]